MKGKNNIDFASLGAAVLILLGVIGLRASLNSKKDVYSEPEVNVIEETTQEPATPVYSFYYTNDTVDVEASINDLRIYWYREYPYDCYKYIRFVDYDNYERYAIVNVYVDYLTDVDKNVVETVYNYMDVFSGRLLLTTNDKRDIKEYNSSEVMYLMECGSLLELRESVISKGLDTNYAYSVMSDDIENKTLSSYDVARYYVLLVNSKNRLSREYIMSMG